MEKNIATYLDRDEATISEVTMGKNLKCIRAWDVQNVKISIPAVVVKPLLGFKYTFHMASFRQKNIVAYTERIPVTHIIGQLCKDLEDGLFVHNHKINPTRLHL